MIPGIASTLSNGYSSFKASLSNTPNRIAHLARFIFLGAPIYYILKYQPVPPFLPFTAFTLGIVRADGTRAVIKELNNVFKNHKIASFIIIFLAAPHFAPFAVTTYYCAWLGCRVKG